MMQASAGSARTRLLALLTERSYAKKRVVLASGKESDFFIDCKQTVLSAEGHALVAQVMLDVLAGYPAFDAVAGVELGGCPLASAVAQRSFATGAPKDAIYVRKDAKDHGSKRLLEGDAHLPQGTRVILLEDVVTTGGSTLKALDKLKEAGRVVVGVLALVDRLEGGREAIAERTRFESVFSRSDFPT
jgi:orotate phosphoribosyltransferase